MATPSLGFDNRFSTTLSSGISSSDTVIPVNSVPTASEGYLVIDSDNASYEIIYYTSKGASSVTCPSAVLGRGLGGTTAVSHSSGSGVKSMVVAEHFEALQDGTALAAGAITPAKWTNPYKFRAYRNAALNTVSASLTKMPFDAEDFDSNSNFDITTNVGRYTAPVAGFYQFNARFAVVHSGFIEVMLYKNGVQEAAGGREFYTPGQVTAALLSVLAQAAANDYFEVYYYVDGVNGIDVSRARCYFSGYLVSMT